MNGRFGLRLVGLLFFAAALAGCATPPENPALVEARLLFAALLSQPQSVTLTATQTHAAFEPLAQADLLSNKDRCDPRIEALSTLARQRVAVAQLIIAESESAAASMQP
ncbi:hypothetical protein [Pseudomonas yamanorum]|uniref:Lipoprotein n=1 Tax=Pseudomonas yamanorum TaxID=515393 RepID=A0AAJ3H922_9PSED|nr:hypothetical protein [Pseudomonas yamanorum]NWD45903.1 hypothetical protein [Pseudomonas yamanorum]